MLRALQSLQKRAFHWSFPAFQLAVIVFGASKLCVCPQTSRRKNKSKSVVWSVAARLHMEIPQTRQTENGHLIAPPATPSTPSFEPLTLFCLKTPYYISFSRPRCGPSIYSVFTWSDLPYQRQANNRLACLLYFNNFCCFHLYTFASKLLLAPLCLSSLLFQKSY